MEDDKSFALPLRPVVSGTGKKDMLPVRIAQINAQRGSFRSVTEQSLQDELQARKEKGDESDGESAMAPSEIDASDRQETVYKRRAEILQFAVQAHTEATMALDVISLLLSKHNPRQAEPTMSATLKQMVPSGSLDIDVIKMPEQPKSTVQEWQTVARGWKLEGFNAAASKLLKAASRLEKEAAVESQYWDELLTVKNKGWKVCRLPRERQLLGVQFGFLEAAPTFRDRGLASLHRADNGSLVLDRGLLPSRPRAVRIRVKKNNKIVGSSRLSDFVAAGGDTIEARILQSRDSLFEEELFYELTREARILASSGVVTHRNSIHFEYDEEEQIILDIVDLDDISEESEDYSHERDTIAQATSYALRILLCYAHRRNSQRRMQLPQPLSTQKRPALYYDLLRPILSYLQHRSHVSNLQTTLRNVYQILRSAGLQSEYSSRSFSSIRLADGNRSSTLPAVESFVRPFLNPIESSFSGTLANPTSKVTVTIHTNRPEPTIRHQTTPPSLGTEYEFSFELPNFPHMQAPGRIGLKSEAESLLLHLITLDLTTYIATVSRRQAEGAGGSEGTKVPLRWEAPFAHYGELVAVRPDDESRVPVKTLSIHLSREELCLRQRTPDDPGAAKYNPPVQGESPGQLVYTWKSSDVAGPGQKTLEQVIREISVA